MFLKPTEHCPSDGTHRPVCQPVRRGSFATIPPLYCQSPDKGGQQGPSCALALPFASPVKPATPEKLHSVRCLVVHLLEESSSEASESAPANLQKLLRLAVANTTLPQSRISGSCDGEDKTINRLVRQELLRSVLARIPAPRPGLVTIPRFCVVLLPAEGPKYPLIFRWAVEMCGIDMCGRGRKSCERVRAEA